jgi:hypothetical protein
MQFVRLSDIKKTVSDTGTGIKPQICIKIFGTGSQSHYFVGTFGSTLTTWSSA